MTQAQEEANLCGMVPTDHDPRFAAQHMAAYVFARSLVAGKRVLAIGFGEGYGADYLAQAAAEVIGVDMASGNIPRASAKYQRTNLSFQRMDATRLAFPDGTFDAVCSFQVIEHIPEPQLPSAVADVARVLKPGGFYCLSTLNLAHNMKPGKPYEKLIYHEKEFTAPELEALLRGAFPEVDMRGLHFTRTHRVFDRLKKWGLDRFGPASLNPVARFFQQTSPGDFRVTRDVSAAALDLYAICRKL